MRFRKSVLFVPALVALASSAAFAQPSTVIVVRHAEKAAAPANDPVLTPVGEQRARDLAASLAHAGVGTIITTQFQRTQSTAKPLADTAKLTITVVAAASDTKAHAEAVAAKARAAAVGSVVLIVGHSNTVPAIIAALGGPTLPAICDAEHANLFVLAFPSTGAPKLIRGKYGAADPPESDACARGMRQP